MATAQRHCKECGAAYEAPHGKPQTQYCSIACRRGFNNRRMTRGAELYDFYMSSRFERATHGGNIAIMNQMASVWREEDKALRAGRFSWTTPDLDGDPRAFATVARNMREWVDGAE